MIKKFNGGVKHTEQNTSTALHGTPGIEIAAEIHEVILTFCILRELWKSYHLLNALSASKSGVLLPLPDKPPVSASAYFSGIFISLQSMAWSKQVFCMLVIWQRMNGVNVKIMRSTAAKWWLLGKKRTYREHMGSLKGSVAQLFKTDI